MSSDNLVLAADGAVVVGEPHLDRYPAGAVAVPLDAALVAQGVWLGWRWQGGAFVDPRVPAVDLIAYAADARWRIEVGGTTWNGFPVATDDRSKTLVSGELQAIDLAERKDGEPFKFADGVFRPLSNADMQAVAVAMRAHVKRSFGALYAVGAGIAAGTVTTAEQVDAALAAAMAA
ncbi:DUF4376 domain-containing protein [Methylobacterium indicum]|uniref:DUF4376 domain-containing protein n=1 Tax=Methylobacterium indicum TaxID=1775910 RepID=A0A8H8WSQ8_9HYPH|nr:DUF4376 domain-containing protein [Methylobacterium indicum]BCM83593.1 hypothetical protein mvi_20540 [Methylobacterium indicum]